MGRISQHALLVGRMHTGVYSVNHDRGIYPSCYTHPIVTIGEILLNAKGKDHNHLFAQRYSTPRALRLNSSPCEPKQGGRA